jgi:hypothetical protein
MTTLAQKDLFSKRWKKVSAPEPSEEQIQKSLVAQLRWGKLKAGVIFFHIPNGAYLGFDEVARNSQGSKLLKMGVLPGVADLLFLWATGVVTRVLFLELKAKGNSLTKAQELFRDNVRTVRAYFECANSIDEALKILERYKLLRGV